MNYRLLPEQEFGPETLFYGGVSGSFASLIKNVHSYWGILFEDKKTVKLSHIHEFGYEEEIGIVPFFNGMAYAQYENIKLGTTYFPESFKDDENLLDEKEIECLLFPHTRYRNNFLGLDISKIPHKFYSTSSEKLIMSFNEESKKILDEYNKNKRKWKEKH